LGSCTPARYSLRMKAAICSRPEPVGATTASTANSLGVDGLPHAVLSRNRMSLEHDEFRLSRNDIGGVSNLLDR
jgi:hypothetical protein